MGAAKPCLGYPSRTACALLSGAKRKRPSVENQGMVCIDLDVLDALRPAADRRGISVNQLCRQLIGCIADDDLTDAILDDLLELTS